MPLPARDREVAQATIPTWCCKTCFKLPDASQHGSLVPCSGCQHVYYCDSSCQQRDFPNHHAECQRITQLQSLVRTEANEIRNIHYLYIWSNVQSREYCRTRAKLARKIERMARNYQVAPLLESVLEHRLELLRIDIRDNLCLRKSVPFTLLRLNQHDRCVAFIAHWLRRRLVPPNLPNSAFWPPPLTISRLHTASCAGDWLYGTADRFADIVAPGSFTSASTISVSNLMALCIVKLRIIAQHEADQQRISLFRTTRYAQLLGDTTHLISRFVVGDQHHAARIAEQARHVERYFDMIHVRNAIMLPSIVNPTPLLNCDADDHDICEAQLVLMSCRTMFVGIPGALERLQRRFGLQPLYDCISSQDDLGMVYD